MAVFPMMTWAMMTWATAAMGGQSLYDQDWPTYRNFLRYSMCGLAPDEKQCEFELDTLRKDFSWSTKPHWGRERVRVGQANLAFCLNTGCGGAIKINTMLACAWAKVIVLSGQPDIVEDDFEREKSYCDSLENTAERDAARAQADRILKRLAGDD